MDKHLHIISFNIPYPANYGGVIDVYYKLKTLHSFGVQIILHCFEYDRPKVPELEVICKKVYYYKRKTGLLANCTWLPYNVYSRKDPELLNNLLLDDYPILFEGLHSCYYISDPRLLKRFKIYRESNIEHDYYRHLAKSGAGFIKNCFYQIEALRFEWYEKTVRYADISLVVSMADTEYLRKKFPDKRIEYMPSFHQNEDVTVEPGKSNFILYHGKLSVEENELAALYLIRNVFSKLSCPCVIAGMNPGKKIIKEVQNYAHIIIEANPSQGRMEELIHQAQIHILITFQDTGLKLKLLNSLFAGRHIVVNDLMLTGTGLQDLCYIANTPDEMVATCMRLINEETTQEAIRRREEKLGSTYSNRFQGERLYQILYGKN